MPNLRSQSIDNQGITMVGSNGVSFTLTKAAIQAFYQSTNGSAASRKSQTVTWAAQQFEAALGTGTISAAQIVLDFDTTTGSPSSLDITS